MCITEAILDDGFKKLCVLFPQGSEIFTEDEAKDFRTRGDGWHPGNSVSQTQQDRHTSDLTEPMAVYKGHTQIQSSWGSSAERKTRTQGPNLNQPRIYLQMIPDGKGKIRFLRWSLMGILNHTSE